MNISVFMLIDFTSNKYQRCYQVLVLSVKSLYKCQFHDYHWNGYRPVKIIMDFARLKSISADLKKFLVSWF
jgi:hypothetical protein